MREFVKTGFLVRNCSDSAESHEIDDPPKTGEIAFGYFFFFSNAFSKKYKGAATIQTINITSWTVEFFATDSASLREPETANAMRNKPANTRQKRNTGNQSGP